MIPVLHAEVMDQGNDTGEDHHKIEVDTSGGDHRRAEQHMTADDH